MTLQADYISNNADIIDSRDVIARIEELREAVETADPSDEEMIESLRDELAPLEALAAEASGCAADWEHGEALIRDSYFETYARELAEDIGAIDSNASWPNTCIDWECAARQLQQDYTAVDFDGVTYWVRQRSLMDGF